MTYEPIIGLEIHVQLGTKTKMFCRCSADVFGKAPNSVTCPVCLGLPGALPVTNGEAVRLALLAGEALGSSHPKVSKFDRKNYFYPDLPKGYQISQADLPFNIGGEVLVDGVKIALTRAHLEEDAGKLIHEADQTLVDLNRSGLPLLEIVSEPVITSPAQARSYGQKVQLLMRYAGVSEADMEKGSLRMDANISLRPVSTKKLGTKVEVKNINSFRSVEKALIFEIERQTKLLQKGAKIIQETRGWDEGQQVTISQRVKEGSDDYRYFPEPDLPAIAITPQAVAAITKDYVPFNQALAELMKNFATSMEQASIVLANSDLKTLYYQAANDLAKKSQAENFSLTAFSEIDRFISRDVTELVKLGQTTWDKVLPIHIAEIVFLGLSGQITLASRSELLLEVIQTGNKPLEVVKKRGYIRLSDVIKLTEMAQAVISKNTQAVSDYHHGKEQVFGFLLGQLQKESNGNADPTIARQVLQDVLKKP